MLHLRQVIGSNAPEAYPSTHLLILQRPQAPPLR